MDISKKKLRLLRNFLKHFLGTSRNFSCNLFSMTPMQFFETLKCKHLDPNSSFNLFTQTQLILQNQIPTQH